MAQELFRTINLTLEMMGNTKKWARNAQKRPTSENDIKWNEAKWTDNFLKQYISYQYETRFWYFL